MIYQESRRVKIGISVAPSVRVYEMCYTISDSLTGSYRD